ncbi:hypothetical protein FKW77_002246 [Venturia effusa]|uniref:Heterokaryon incompatibility domain-containing protein n=1 Tax=Venturia effusa TaxID=50376 RepID=A0A517LKY2_9PEZI|nr:hypothetical protein FKW77_002246 [Venturia effusa]
MLAGLRRANEHFDHDHNRLSGFSEYRIGFTEVGGTDIDSAKTRRATFQLAAVGDPPSHIRVVASMKYKKELIQSEAKLVIFAARDPDPRLGEGEKYDLIGRWLIEDKSTVFAFKANTIPTMPKRLLSITHTCSHILSLIQLINTQDLPQSERSSLEYVTLSHRWGLSQHFVTQKASLVDRYRGFKVDELPLTFRDAVAVAYKFSFRYLWIDALCIVQDDEEDWEQEAVRMGGIYNSSALTIAAHCSADDNAGFLEPALKRPPAQRIPYDSAHETGQEWEIYGAQVPNFDADVTASPLCKRAWVLQERLLAPRTLHFANGFVYWESLQNARSEDGEVSEVELKALLSQEEAAKNWMKNSDEYDPFRQDVSVHMIKKPERKTEACVVGSKFVPGFEDGAASSRLSRPFGLGSRFCLSDMPELNRILYQAVNGPQQSSIFDRMIVPFDYNRRLEGQEPNMPQSSPVDWFKIVEFYSTTSITHSKDRLIVISGLARHIHRRIGVPYYCGLWADRFLIQLLWFRGGSTFTWPEQSRAPSWSWAYIDGDILYPLGIQAAMENSSVRVIGLAAEPMIRGGANLSRISWLGGIGSPILQVKICKITNIGFWISGDEELSTGPRKRSQIPFGLLEFQRNIVAMRLRYHSRTVGLIVWDDAKLNGDKTPIEFKATYPPIYCIPIAQMKSNAPPRIEKPKRVVRASRQPSKSSDEDITSVRRVKRAERRAEELTNKTKEAESNSSSEIEYNKTPMKKNRTFVNGSWINDKKSLSSRPAPSLPKPKISDGSHSARQALTRASDHIVLVLFVVPVDDEGSTFRRIGCGQISADLAENAGDWEEKSIAII